MPRKPEIGNVQLYPNRPLKKADRNGYVLKFYCPIRGKRIRKSCGTRDRREARKVLRECRERLLDGSYLESDGAITAAEEQQRSQAAVVEVANGTGSDATETDSKTWEWCFQKYRHYRTTRSKKDTFLHSRSRLGIAEKIFQGLFDDRGESHELFVKEVMTLEMIEYLQERLLAGDECRYDVRSPNTVNSMVASVMAFVRFCAKRDWIDRVPPVERLAVDDVMKGRPITGEELERMLEATPEVVGEEEAESWRFALRIIWFSGFRVGDLMDFHWEDARHTRPVWSVSPGVHPTITVPSSQKNGKAQEIPMLPKLDEFLSAVPATDRVGWVVHPKPMNCPVKGEAEWFQPSTDDLKVWAKAYNNLAIATACGVTETTVRNWLRKIGYRRKREFKVTTGPISAEAIAEAKSRSHRGTGTVPSPRSERMTKERVGRIIGLIGEAAGVVVRQEDERTSTRVKYASAHDIRRGCAQRLINAGVSAETLKVVMRHADFTTTEKYYGATRSAQAAASEVRQKLSPNATTDALVGGLMGGHEKTPRFDTEELLKLKALLERL
ncbi:MAG: site-specific integrase [Planctomycetota bacterium]